MLPNFQQLTTDILILGAGAAGLQAGSVAAKTGKSVLVVSKTPAGKSTNTIMAGGLFSFPIAGYSEQEHLKKTLASGAGLCNVEAVKTFIAHSAALMERFFAQGLQGNTVSHGFACVTSFLPGGPQLIELLLHNCQQQQVKFLENVLILGLLKPDARCLGAWGIQRHTGEYMVIKAGATILATGGAGGLYAFNDNAIGLLGDGYVHCLEAGLDLIDLEFVQFYPAGLLRNRNARMNIFADMVDLGKLTNSLGEDLKEKYQIFEQPIAVRCRDKLSIAMEQELRAGNGHNGALLLDLRYIRFDQLSPRSKDLLSKRPEFFQQPIPIHPTCHHTMGGVVINSQGYTSLPGLWAAGEVTGGIHGANRMGGNALCEALVFGELAGLNAAHNTQTIPSESLKSYIQACYQAIQPQSSLLSLSEEHKQVCANLKKADSDLIPNSYSAVLNRLKIILWEQAGIIRNENKLCQAQANLEQLNLLLHTWQPQNLADNLKYYECRQAIIVGQAIVRSAYLRTESRGSHCRNDFPQTDPKWLQHIAIYMQKNKLKYKILALN